MQQTRRSHRQRGFRSPRFDSATVAVAASTRREWSCTAAGLEQGREAPPVRLIRDGDAFLVQDGRHRIDAARAAGHTVIEADVRHP